MDENDPAYENELAKVRKEAAKYRTRLSKFSNVFDGYTEAEVDWWLQTADTLKTDPDAAATQMRDVAYKMLEDKFFEGIETPTPTKEEPEVTVEDPDIEKIVADAVQKALTAAKQEQQQTEQERLEQAYKDLVSELDGKGVKEGTESFAVAMFRISQGSDVDSALEGLIQGEETETPAETETETPAETEAPTFPPVSESASPASPENEPPSTLEEASARFQAMLEGKAGE